MRDQNVNYPVVDAKLILCLHGASTHTSPAHAQSMGMVYWSFTTKWLKLSVQHNTAEDHIMNFYHSLLSIFFSSLSTVRLVSPQCVRQPNSNFNAISLCRCSMRLQSLQMFHSLSFSSLNSRDRFAAVCCFAMAFKAHIRSLCTTYVRCTMCT